MKVIIDDTYYSVNEKVGKWSYNEIFRFTNHFDFNDCLRELLTPSQMEIFIGYDTRRTFDVSDKKIERYRENYIEK